MEDKSTNYGILFYKLDTCTIFQEALSVTGENNIGKFKLENEILIVELKKEYNTTKEARDAINPVLKSWQIEDEIIRVTTSGFRFAYWKASMQHIPNQISDGQEKIKYEKNYNDTLIIASRIYPQFPKTIFTTEMESAWIRYKKAKIGIGESIQSASYYLLTVAINYTGKNFKEAASFLLFDHRILKKIGELSSTRGTLFTSRKSTNNNFLELKREEIIWLDHAVKYLLIQLGIINGGEAPKKIELNDLPKL